ncbi:YfhO family protein [Ligilactobacillus aviarius]|uniref:YfhO family protein n=1 Tax=Ligilactobacillus aviarius TaxID=1606 RepID=UPI001179BA41|nr:YfhO family protein [Ligilactobacillus aviarius]
MRELFFILLALLFILPMLIHGFIPCGDDWGYHIDRIIEISNNMRHGNFFPMMYTYTFRKIGYLLGAFYPWITLLPFAILKNLISNQVVAIALGFAFYIFISLNLTFHVSNKVFKNKLQSLLVSTIYVFSGYVLVDCYQRMALGEFLSLMFLPVAVYGFYAVFFGNEKEWPYLAFGMSVIVLSHVLSTFITSLMFAIIAIVLFHWINNRKQRFIRLGFAVLTCIASSAIFLFPFAEQELYQSFGQPSPNPLQGTNFGDLVISSLNGNGYALGPIIILVLLFGLILWKELGLIEKSSYVIGTIALIISSSLFPWSSLNKTVFDVIQFPFRLYMVVTIFYAIVAGKIFLVLFDKFKQHTDKFGKIAGKVLMFIVILLPWFGSAINYMVSEESNYPENMRYTDHYKVYSDLDGLWLSQYTPQDGENYLGNVIGGAVIADDVNDTISSKNIVSEPNALKFTGKTIDDATSLDLPVYNYKNIYVFRDGKQVEWTPSDNDTVTINTPKLKGPVTVKYIPSFVDWLGIMLSIETWIAAIVFYIWNRKKKGKSVNNERR